MTVLPYPGQVMLKQRQQWKKHFPPKLLKQILNRDSTVLFKIQIHGLHIAASKSSICRRE